MIADGKTVRVPPPLVTGDRVVVVSPAGPSSAKLIRGGERFLKRRGLVVIRGKHALERRGYLAGNDEDRLEDLNRALAHRKARAVFFTRGGYGTMRLLERVRLDPLRRYPKTLLGYSDLTPLLNHVHQQTGLVTYLGPMVASDMSRGLRGRTRSSYEMLVEQKGGPLRIAGPPGTAGERKRSGFLVPGNAEGLLVGGCLTMLAAVLGTPFQPDFRGKVLFWEEVNEPYYRIDRLLSQLRLAGAFDQLAGMIVGRLAHCGSKAPRRGESSRIFLEDQLGRERYPVYFGFPSGHGPMKVTLPIGLPALLDSDRGLVRIAG